VVLSACQTAVTEFRRLPDEAIGLSTGCLQAGAAGVVSTLWPVADASTALLMVRFYELCLGRGGAPPLDPAAALGEAQRWLRDATREELARWLQERGALRALLPGFTGADGASRPYRAAFYWAPFTFVGA
jgi:CHAT domain-containing protein